MNRNCSFRSLYGAAMLSQDFNQIIQDYIAPAFAVMCLLGQIIGWRMWLRLVKSKRAKMLVHFVFIMFNLAWFFSVFALYRSEKLTDTVWSWVARPATAWQLTYLFGILPLGLFFWIVIGAIRRLRPKKADNFKFNENRRDFLKTAGAVGSLAVIGISGYGVARQGLPPKLVRHTITIKNLPPALDGFKIGHVTDIHLGLWANQRELAQSLEVVATEKPHLVALTGDLVDRKPHYARLYYEPLKILSDVPHGVWGVLGNHDHYAGPLEIAELLDGHGMNMLMDKRVNLPGAPITIIGLDDQGVHHNWMGNGVSAKPEDNDMALNFQVVSGPSARPDDFVLLLNHRPEGLSQALEQGVQLYLAGHTHGGQYQVPYYDQANLAAVFYKYSSGLYNEREAWINVSKGVAAVGIPYRLWAWPSVDLITLKAG
ncbi:hypothetical protein C4J81_05590 [Deltaproteobacteria bacterium Smac51]|nr:hypothetical protein C4J81_05590 [Deltaproteobacteria bacterium Smac51]